MGRNLIEVSHRMARAKKNLMNENHGDDLFP